MLPVIVRACLVAFCFCLGGVSAQAALTAPATLSTTAVKATSFTLTWTAATGATGGIAGYNVYRDGSLIGAAITTRTFAVLGLTPTASYSMTVTARDGAGNVSPVSAALVVMTPADTTVPTRPVDLTAANLTTTSFTLSWTSSTDNVGVTGYNIYRAGVLLGSSLGTSFAVSGLTPDTNNNMTVRATDAAGNVSSASVALAVRTLAEPPTTPAGLITANLRPASFTLKWNNSTGGTGGITGYDVYLNGTLVGSPTARYLSIGGLTPTAAYTMTVVSRDTVGNVSTPSSPLVVITPSDTTKPTVPKGLSAADVTSSTFTLTWTFSTDNVGVSGYEVYRNNVLIGSTAVPTYTVTGLAPTTLSSMRVKARDAAGNVSGYSASLAVTTSAPPNVPPVVMVTAPDAGSTFTLPFTTFAMTAAATDSDGTITKVEFFDDATKLGETATAVSGQPDRWLLTLSSQLSAGIHSLTARATDNRNATTDSAPVVITVKNPNQAPVVTLGVSAGTLTAPGFLTLTADAADSDGTIAKVEFFEGGNSLGEILTPTTTPSTFAFPLTLFSAGVYTLTAVATDDSAVQATSAPVIVTVQSGAAALPYVANFELAEGYRAGPLVGQLSWQGTGGVAIVPATSPGSQQELSIPAAQPVEILSHGFSAAGVSPVFVDFQARPVAGVDPDTAVMFSTPAAQVALVGTTTPAQLWIFGGGVGWYATGQIIPINPDGRTSNWIRLTTREDYLTKKWDLYLDGQMITADVAFADATASALTDFSVNGHTATASTFDSFYAGPENPIFADANHNGLSDDWETAHGLSLARDNRQLSPAGNGVAVLQAYLTGTDPNDYFNGQTPTLAIVSGNNQTAPVGQFNAQPLVVSVKNAAGIATLANAPVTFTVQSGGGKLALTSTGTSPFATTLSVTTDMSGNAQVCFQQPATANAPSSILVSAGSAQSTFITTSTADGAGFADIDADGLPDSWELYYLGSLDFGPTDQSNDMDRTLAEYYEQGIVPRWRKPTVAAGLRAWYSAGSLTGFDPNTGGLALWGDLSGNGFHLHQSELAAQPLDILPENGAQFTYFFGGQWMASLSADVFAGATDFTVLAVLRPDTPQSENSTALAFGNAVTNGFRLGLSGSVGSDLALVWPRAEDYFLQGTTLSVAATLNTPQQLTVIKNGTTQTVYLNGVLQASGSVAADLNAVVENLSLGGTGTTGSFSGAIYETLVYNRALSVSEQQQVEDALLRRYRLDDADRNGLPDRWENKNFGQTGVDSSADPDGDGLTNLQEQQLGTNPSNADSDGDGVSDGQEKALGTDPNNPDSKAPLQATWLSRTTYSNTSTYPTETFPGPGLRGFRNDSEDYYMKFEWKLKISGGPDSGVTASFVAEIVDPEQPGTWYLNNQAHDVYEWSFFAPGESISSSGFIAWHSGPYGLLARDNYIARATYYGWMPGSDTTMEWTEPGFYTGADDQPHTYDNTYKITLSNPSDPLVVPGHTTTSTNVGAWSTELPTASQSGNASSFSAYNILVPEGMTGTLRWFEVFTPESDPVAKQYTAREWIITGPKSPDYMLIAPGAGGSTIVPYAAQLAVDANRDGQIKLASEDATSADKPYRFWLNDDIDREVAYTNVEQGTNLGANPHIVDFIGSHVSSFGVNETEEDDVSTDRAQANGWNLQDWQNNRIYAKRDLEDFGRLWISTPGLVAALRPKDVTNQAEADLYLGLQWADVTGSPAVMIYPHVETDGGTKYLTDTTVAGNQVTFDYAMKDFRDTATPDISLNNVVAGTDVFIIPPRYFRYTSDSQPNTYLLFEGASAGKGRLKLVILRKDGTNYTPIGDGGSVWLELKTPHEFIERWTCGDDALGVVQPVVRADSKSGTFAPPATDEEKDYILYVHGYNMQEFEKQRWVEATYKRLWHLGYKGRVGSFTWPCSQTATPYDESEERAWQSAQQLKNLLSSLKIAGYRVHMLAHSQGNVVAGEALRLAGANSGVVRTYIASQAAIQADCYNTNNLQIQDWGSSDSGTPNIYLNYSGTNSPYLGTTILNGAAARFANFFNPSDYALTGNSLSFPVHPGWELNQRLKPDGSLSVFSFSFGYDPGLGFQEWKNGGWQVLQLPDDRYRIFSYAAEGRSKALGTQPTGGAFTSFTNLQSMGYADEHIWHSGQFRGSQAVRYQYWIKLLDAALIPHLNP